MDPDTPKPEDRGDSTPAGDSSARDRAESLTRKDPEAGTSPGGDSPGNSGGKTTGPVLTERQRIEARKRRQARRRRPVKGNPFARGLRATAFEIRRTAAFLGNAVLAALASLGPLFSRLGIGFVWLVEKAGKGLSALGRLIRRGLVALGQVAVALDRVITPHRALILVAGVAAVLLGVSQFKGLGAIEIGQTGYTGIEDLTRAPTIDKTTPAGVHTKILVPIAAIAFLAVVVIALGSLGSVAKRLSRWRRLASMVLITIGLLTLVVTLLIDLPDATDTAEAAIAYADVRAILLSGFWLQLAAGATLTVTGLALLFEPSTRPVRERQSEGSGSRRDRRPAAVPDDSGMNGMTGMSGSRA